MDPCRVVPPEQLPANRHHASVARVVADFDAVLAAIGAQATHEPRSRLGPAFRYVVLELTGGRHALLIQDDHEPDHFSIHLQPIRDIAYRRADFDAVCRLIGVPSSQIIVFTGQVRWK